MNKFGNENPKNLARDEAVRMTVRVLVGIRKFEGISIDQIANTGALSKSTITKLESGAVKEGAETSRISFDCLERYCNGIGIDFSTAMNFIGITEKELRGNKEAFATDSPRDTLLRFLLHAANNE